VVEVMVHTAECNPAVCYLFSQRGNGIMVKFPGPYIDVGVLMLFLSELCEKCGEQVRVNTSPRAPNPPPA
jgi:hypothetical protein